jgi:hypothetical protein
MKRETRNGKTSKTHLSFRVSSAVVFILILTARAQFSPDGPATAPSTEPRELKLVTPAIDKNLQQIELPVNFWNEKMTGWVETALTGLPSDFSHETVAAATLTRSTMVDAMHQAGFHDADAWVSNVRDFPRIRGDKALILLEVRRKDHTETYLMDELLTFGGWNTSVGPYGWMFKGKPGEGTTNGATPADPPASPQTAPATAPAVADDNSSVAVQVLRDDPQIALRFLGLQHSSQSFIDHPLCYDEWIYPIPRFYRNTRVLPEDVFDSNGAISVKMIIRKVTEEEFLKTAVKYWHDPAAAQNISGQLPLAQHIDADKAELWALIPKIRDVLAQSRIHPETVVLANSLIVARAGVLAASIEKNYAAMDCAWATWACEHRTADTSADTDPDTNRSLDEEAKLYLQHAEVLRDRAAALYAVQIANAAKLKLRLTDAPGPESKLKMRQLSGQAMVAKSQAQLAENLQTLAYWRQEQSRIDPKDPREDWIREIHVQRVLAEARESTAQAGIAFGNALQSDAPGFAAAESAYQSALVQMTIAGLNAQLASVEFEIHKRDEDQTDPDLPGYIKQRDEIKAKIAAAQATMQPIPDDAIAP